MVVLTNILLVYVVVGATLVVALTNILLIYVVVGETLVVALTLMIAFGMPQGHPLQSY
jgi:hypothetical protein